MALLYFHSTFTCLGAYATCDLRWYLSGNCNFNQHDVKYCNVYWLRQKQKKSKIYVIVNS